MGDVYSNSFCTIAATASPDCTFSFLNRTTAPPIVKLPTVGAFDNPCFYATLKTQPELELELDPLSTRAWALQERILASRVIFFTKQRLYWQCACSSGSEDLITPPTWSKSQLCLPYPNSYLYMHKTVPEAWFHVLEKYTRCSLTYKTDNLYAITGLMEVIRQRTGKHHFAGIWTDQLHQSLLWCKADTLLEAIDELKFPSWSWARYRGAIQHVDMFDFTPAENITIDSSAGSLSATMVTVTAIQIGKRFLDTPSANMRYDCQNYMVLDTVNDKDIGWIIFDEGDANEQSIQYLEFVPIIHSQPREPELGGLGPEEPESEELDSGESESEEIDSGEPESEEPESEEPESGDSGESDPAKPAPAGSKPVEPETEGVFGLIVQISDQNNRLYRRQGIAYLCLGKTKWQELDTESGITIV